MLYNIVYYNTGIYKLIKVVYIYTFIGNSTILGLGQVNNNYIYHSL